MEKKLAKHGNSYALIIDKPILDLLGIDADTPLTVTTDGRVLFVAPAKTSPKRRRIQDALEAGNRKYSKALKKLSE